MKKKIISRRFKNFKCGDGQLAVETYARGRKFETADIDVLRLTVASPSGKHRMRLDMTPDEALSIASTLSTAAMFWLINYKPYWDTFMKRKRALSKRFKETGKEIIYD